jgi:uncharacterized protein YodC (DUF2158 family)
MKMKENRMPFIPGDIVRLKSGGFAMTVAKATDTEVECDWCDGKKLRSKTFHPDQLTTTDSAPTINLHFVQSDDDGRPESEPSWVDVRDIADAAVAELLRRERASHPLPRTTIELVGPDTLTGAEVAAIWASVLRTDVRYGGDDLAAFESQAAGMMPGWMAHDFRVMLRAFHRFGLIPGNDSRVIFDALIGHPLRSYRAFAEEAAANW